MAAILVHRSRVNSGARVLLRRQSIALVATVQAGGNGACRAGAACLVQAGEEELVGALRHRHQGQPPVSPHAHALRRQVRLHALLLLIEGQQLDALRLQDAAATTAAAAHRQLHLFPIHQRSRPDGRVVQRELTLRRAAGPLQLD